MTATLREIVATRFGGKLKSGQHEEDGEACVLEACSVARGVKWTDNPQTVGLPDLRGINDSRHWPSEEARAEFLIPVAEALWDWALWSRERKAAVLARVAERSIREVLPIALEAAARVQRKEEHRDALLKAAQNCKDQGTEGSAREARAAAASSSSSSSAAAAANSAAAAAYYAAAAAYYAAAAANSAAAAAYYAANAADAASAATANAAYAANAPTPFDILKLHCRIWIECAAEVGGSVR